MTEKSDEKVTRDLYAFYRKAYSPGEALERLAVVLARSPVMFTRMVPVLDDLREEDKE